MKVLSVKFGLLFLALASGEQRQTLEQRQGVAMPNALAQSLFQDVLGRSSDEDSAAACQSKSAILLGKFVGNCSPRPK